MTAILLSGIVLKSIAYQLREGFDWFSTLLGLLVAALACVFWYFTLSRNRPVPWALLAGAVVGSVGLGTVGFVVGFFGPLIFAPDANQGPLLGIFITGPLGLIFGAIAGALFVHFRTRSKEP